MIIQTLLRTGGFEIMAGRGLGSVDSIPGSSTDAQGDLGQLTQVCSTLKRLASRFVSV